MKPIDQAIAGLLITKTFLTDDQQVQLLTKLLGDKKTVVVQEYPDPKNFREKIAKWIRGY